jgi:hypothetical protein
MTMLLKVARPLALVVAVLPATVTFGVVATVTVTPLSGVALPVESSTCTVTAGDMV